MALRQFAVRKALAVSLWAWVRNTGVPLTGGSAEKAVITLLSDEEMQLSEEDWERLTRLIDQAKQNESEPSK